MIISAIKSKDVSDKRSVLHPETIKNLISSEIAGKPLSDDKLAGILNKEGMEVARRTVAKYRDMLNIPSSSQRRKQARLMKFASN